LDVAAPLRPLTRAHGALIRGLLREKKTRTSEGAFVIEGANACRDVLRRHSDRLLSLILSPQYLHTEHNTDREIRSQLPVRQFTCADSVFATLSDVEVPQGILAVVRQPEWDEEKVLNQASVLGIYGERLQDPANVGTIIRTAAALNLTGLWLSPDSADCFNPKVVRATAGTILTVPIFRVKDAKAFHQSGCSLYAAVVPAPDTISLRTIRHVPRRLVIAVGNESQGLTPATVKACSLRFSIPLARDVESLNVAATVAIASFILSGLPVAL
jgi:TrmH family RNA methyltransferase